MNAIQESLLGNKKVTWSEEQDELLAKVALRHLEEGRTLTSAFEEVSTVLGRTKAACAFRYNSVLRKKNSSQLQQVIEKKQVREDSDILTADKNEFLSWDTIIGFMSTQREIYSIQQKEKCETEARLHEENSILRTKLEKIEEDIEKLNTVGIDIQQLIHHFYSNAQNFSISKTETI